MGSEQSTQPGDKSNRLKRGKSVPERTRQDSDTSDLERPGSASPVMSVCSDSDLPYISYTVNKPIGGGELCIVVNDCWFCILIYCML